MTVTSFGDMARHHVLNHNLQRLKADMTRLTRDMSTGQVSDPARQLQGHLMPLASLDLAIGQADARMGVTSVLSVRLNAQHAALDATHEHVQNTADMLLRPDLMMTDDRLSPIAKQVGQNFADIVGLLNTQAGGRSLFAGQAVDHPALADARSILDMLASLIPTGADQVVIDQVVGDWFATGGGFEANGYVGGAADGTPIDLGDGISVQFGVTAADPNIRGALAAMAKSALMDADLTDVSAQTRRQVLSAAAVETRSGAALLREVIEKTGISQARVDDAATRQQASKAAATMARNLLIGADPYDTATALQESIARVDQMFAITARLSRLSLSAYL